MNNPEYPKNDALYLSLPILLVCGAVGLSKLEISAITHIGPAVLGILSLSAFILIVITYRAQVIFIKHYYPQKDFRAHIYFLVVALIAPIIISFMADYNGVARYGTASNGTLSNFLVGLTVGGVIFVFGLYLFAVGNSIYVGTRGLKTAYNIFSKIVYSIGWLAIAGICLVLYSIIYSFHDPSTE